MPYFPTINETSSSREMIDVFQGYNHKLKIDEGQFYDMKNLSSANYHTLSPRGQRSEYA